MRFGDLITKELRNRRMKAKELADRLGVSPTTISFWRSSVSYPRVEHLRELAELFGWDFRQVQDMINAEKLAEVDATSEQISANNALVPFYRDGEVVGHYSLPRVFGATQNARLLEVEPGKMILVNPVKRPQEGTVVAIRKEEGGPILIARLEQYGDTRWYVAEGQPPIPEAPPILILGSVALILIRPQQAHS